MKKISKIISSKNRILFLKEEFFSTIEKVKYNIAEHIFYSGNYNTELYKYAAEKVGYSNKQSKTIKKTIPLQNLKKAIFPQKIKKNNEKSDFFGSFSFSLLLVLVSLSLIGFHVFWASQNSRLFNEVSR